MLKKVAEAIDGVKLLSRFNDWTSDRVVGLPIEICRYGGEGQVEGVVIERHAGSEADEAGFLAAALSRERARAALTAMLEPTDTMKAIAKATDVPWQSMACYKGMIDDALAEG